MFAMINAPWRGAITDVMYMGDASEPTTRAMHFEADMTGEWVACQSRLILETDITGNENRSVERFIQRFEVADALYFSDYKSEGAIALEGNKVELLAQNKGMVSFLIKRRTASGIGGRLPHAEIRQLAVSGDSSGWPNCIITIQC